MWDVPEYIWDIPASAWDVPARMWDVPVYIWDIPASAWDVPARMWDVPSRTWDVPDICGISQHTPGTSQHKCGTPTAHWDVPNATTAYMYRCFSVLESNGEKTQTSQGPSSSKLEFTTHWHWILDELSLENTNKSKTTLSRQYTFVKYLPTMPAHTKIHSAPEWDYASVGFVPTYISQYYVVR
ncbi:hypothetical protein GGX14DRAFT_402127 [Mycena pura]|uniref:Uncharacterized protein n=1 Tax=Mycena pura TaxID=153505 RepID=A0AAD6Y3Z3_9AGAR|nr:hypothetical protein GGX14DRAFT_402127 [Mycena pura]